jgi:hypothetical protein
MINDFRRALPALIALVLFPVAALAAPKPFTLGAPGWDHTVGISATAPTPRAQETWKKKDGEYVTYLEDGGLSYDDALAAVKKNMADNNFTAAVDTDRKCDGRRAHEIEMTFGTTIVHQIMVDDAPGLTKVTYARPQGTPAGADAMSALNAYCGGP